MSKASEWRSRAYSVEQEIAATDRARPKWSTQNEGFSAVLATGGDEPSLHIEHHGFTGRIRLDQHEALSFAEWIIDTFGEKK